ncbi:MAG: pyridoxal phosphate-dependent aminotransferase family protein [Sedimentisphaerales bacterium]|nr:pyridoxal phosphate-dependent aminotransferase family protein [Sedimentisphaerales bacterium]
MQMLESPPGPRVIINNKEMDYFCGCGYFGLQGHPELLEAACQAIRDYGLGSATSRLGYGNNPALLAVESNAAEFFETESALYYSSGYMGNSILLQGLSDDYDVIFMDKDSHYSVRDGVSIARKPVVCFAHRDADDLKVQLRRHLGPTQRPLVISDGVFPVSGQIAPIPDYLEALQSYDPFIICVDDAHATGVIGKKGHGTFEHYGISDARLFSCGTLSKALGGYGGMIAGDNALRGKLITKSHMIFSSSPPPPPIAAASAKALEILIHHPELRHTLWDNVAYAKKGLRTLGFQIDETPVPIICLSSETTSLERLPQELLSKGIAISRWYANSQAYSSVPANGAIRIAIFATHSREQIDRLVDAIRALV